MGEVGCDLHEAYPVPLTEDVLARADVVVTLGRSVGEIEVPQAAARGWRIGDPVGAPLERFSGSATTSTRVQELLVEVLPPPPPPEEPAG
jgi:hypothetical protein